MTGRTSRGVERKIQAQKFDNFDTDTVRRKKSDINVCVKSSAIVRTGSGTLNSTPPPTPSPDMPNDTLKRSNSREFTVFSLNECMRDL